MRLRLATKQKLILKLIDLKNARIDYEGPSETTHGIQMAIDLIVEDMRTEGE